MGRASPITKSNYNITKFTRQYVHTISEANHKLRKRCASMNIERELVKEINEAALYLYNYYVRTYGNSSIDLLNDLRVAKTIGWTERKVKDYRQKLTKYGYIYFQKKIHENIEYARWIIGKDEVSNFKRSKAHIKIDEQISSDTHNVIVETTGSNT